MTKRIDRVELRGKLPARREPYWLRLSEGRHVGFRLITKASEGTWLARHYDGTRYSFQPLGDFASLAEKERFDAAKAAAEKWFEHLNLGGATKAGTVGDACSSYVEHLKLEKSEGAADAAQGYYRRLILGDEGARADPIAAVDLAKVTRPHFEAWRKRVRKAAGSDSSFNRALTPVRAALNYAKSIGKVATDQAWREALKPIKAAGKRRELYLDAGDRAKLIDSATAEASRYLNTLRLLPLRPGDVASLHVSHFDVRQGTLSIPAGKTDRRAILLSAAAIAHFKECAKGKLPAAWLVSRDDGRQWKKEAWRDEIKLAAAAAHLPSGTVAYTLRHSVITDLVTNGLDLFSVAQISGTSVAMIEKHYGHLQKKHARAALEALAKM